MMPLLVAFVVIALGCGILLLVLGFFPSSRPNGPRPPGLLARRAARLRRVSRKRLLLITVGIVGGVGVWYITGWIIALIIVPVAVVGLPILLAKPATSGTIERLEAIQTWTRSLSGLITAGVGLEQALTVSLANTPEQIKPQVATLVARISARWSTTRALRRFADDLNDPTADLVTAHLILASKVRGKGLAKALDDLAETVYDEVRHRREIETDREKPRTTARAVTLVTTGALTLLALGGGLMNAYHDVIGQLLLTLYVGAYIACLVWMRRMSIGTPAPRILVNTRKTRG